MACVSAYSHFAGKVLALLHHLLPHQLGIPEQLCSAAVQRLSRQGELQQGVRMISGR